MQHYYIGRQPIFDAGQNVIGYELLYRRQDQDRATVIDGDQATSQIFINSFLEMGLEKVVGNHLAFVNVTRNFITNKDLLPPPTSQLVLEILEDIEIDATVIAAVRRLRQMGYLIALDDFIYHPDLKPLVKEAHIVKLDVQALTRPELETHISILKQHPLQLLAEKIETPEMFDRCKELGFDYYQGYFLCKPRVLTGKRTPANRLNAMRMMAELQNPDIDIKGLEKLISQDPTMSYKLMRYINSAAFTLNNKIDSIHHAIVYLGEKEIRRWATLIVLTGIDDKPDELITTSLIRSKMCELLAPACARANKDAAFIVGLFSTLDAMMDQPLPEVLRPLPLSPEITEALLNGTGPYASILGCVIAYEQGEWDNIQCARIGKDAITEIYLESLAWADTILQEIRPEPRAQAH